MTFPDLPLSAFGDLLTLRRQCKAGHAAILIRGNNWKVREIWPHQGLGMQRDGWEVVAVVKGVA